jgi:hypothetical protein
MMAKARFILELAEFLAEHPAIISQDPAFILTAIQQGSASLDEMQDLLRFVAQGVPHLLDEGDVLKAILEAEKIRDERRFGEEPPTKI